MLLPIETGAGEYVSAELLLISDARAVTLKLTNQRPAAVPNAPALIRGAESFALVDAQAVADPARDLANPLKGPFKALPCDWEGSARAALELARVAGILPAFMVDPSSAGLPLDLEIGDVAAQASHDDLFIAARARLPVAVTEEAEIIAFRSPSDMREHAALVIGKRSGERVPLVRLHSECLTGDVFGSLKCDCGPQLDAALTAMTKEARENGGWGILLYLRQEGRGIGLINKLRAYRLQDQGFDTVDANTRLGLPDEARDFAVSARMLELMKVDRIRLMTNNLSKVVAVEDAGVKVIERVPHQLPANPHNEHYLATKRDRSGHLLL